MSKCFFVFCTVGDALSFSLPIIVQLFDKIFKGVVLNLPYLEVNLPLIVQFTFYRLNKGVVAR